MIKKWKCAVCGYVCEGKAPPVSCPQCGVDRSSFVPEGRGQVGLLRDLVASFRLHSVAVHFPNGLIPVMLLAMLLFFVTGKPFFEQTAFFMLCLAFAATPVALASGIYCWRHRFSGVRARIFIVKRRLALLLLLLEGAAVVIRGTHPLLFSRVSALQILYLGLLGGMLVAVVLLGHYGGKLVFEWRQRS